MINTHYVNKKINFTLFLLFAGYFIDFYDLTIFASSYTKLLPDLFKIYDVHKIQIEYLHINIIYTLGIFLGGLSFGILGDKFGRARAIKYSIFIYSSATLLSIINHSLIVFFFLRFISGFGLATEFATSSVLILELFNKKTVPIYTSLLYISGVLGGLLATYLSVLSWKITFLFGGLFGIFLYIFRNGIKESKLLINSNTTSSRGNILKLIYKLSSLKKLLRLAILIMPYNFLICIMFILPNFMNINMKFSYAIHTLLVAFFLGNIISNLLSIVLISYLKRYKLIILINYVLFIIILSLFPIINNELFFYYCLCLGFIGGSLPTTWIQISSKSFGTNQRNTATNTLFVLGRASGIIYNFIIGILLSHKIYFINYIIIIAIIIFALSILALVMTKENYNSKINFTEN